MVITFKFKTFAKLIGVIAGTVAVVAIADKVADKVGDMLNDVYESENKENDTVPTAEDEAYFESVVKKVKILYKTVLRVAIISFVILNVVARAYNSGLEGGVIFGAASMIGEDLTTEDVRAFVHDKKSFSHFMRAVGEAVPF